MVANSMDTLDTRLAQLMLESMADGVFTLDAKGRISTWNPAMERITGYRAAEVLGLSCTILNFNQCMGKSCPAGHWECGIYAKGAVDAKQCALRHKEGRDVPVLKSARLVKDDQGEVQGIVETVTDLTELQRTRRRLAEARRQLGEVHRLDNIIGKSAAMGQVYTAIQAAASSEATVLIRGESGTGKELVAGAIHYNGPRQTQPLVTVNCSALSENLLESELFGHARGAFTGAVRARTGRFEEAAGGTLFLDEIGEISPYIQVKLLRVLQEREIERVGESLKRKIDIRIIAATNKDLYDLVQQGLFREDLYYRLKVFPIQVPPLRDRPEDIPLLAEHFRGEQNHKTGKKIAGFSRQALGMLMDYPFPGNVRELENAVEHAFVLCRGDEIDSSDLPLEIRQQGGAGHAEAKVVRAQATPRARFTLDRDGLVELLEACRWNKAEVARRVGVSRTAIWKYMKKWEIPLKPQQ